MIVRPITSRKTEIRKGDLFTIGEHHLLCGDCTNQDDVELLMNGKNSELLFTSPPYSDMRTYSNVNDLSCEHLSEFINNFSKYCNYQAVNLGIKRKNSEIIPYWDTYIKKANIVGYKLMAWNVWHKPNRGSISMEQSLVPIAHEFIFVFGFQHKTINKTEFKKTTKDKREFKWRRQANGETHLSTTAPSNSPFKKMGSCISINSANGVMARHHPAIYPIELPTEYIKAFTNQNEIIVDPFLGSGTTIVASEMLGRICYGMEIFPPYCQLIVDRMIKLNPMLIVKKNGAEYYN